MSELLGWHVYEISAHESSLNGVMLRGRIRKFGLENGLNVLAENTEDEENGVRYAVLDVESGRKIANYVLSIIGDAQVEIVRENIKNPVLSKLKVNLEDRYTL